MFVSELQSLGFVQKRSKEFLEFEAQERAKEAAALKRITDSYAAETSKVYRGMLKQMTTVWSRPLSTLRSAWSSQNSHVLAGLYFDVLLRPTAEDGSAIREGEQTGDDAHEQFMKFVSELPSKTGFVLSPTSGMQRFQLFTLVQTRVGKHLVNDANMAVYFNVMKDSEVFAPEDLAYDEKWIARAPEPAHVSSAADFENLSLMSDEGAILGRKIAEELFNREAVPNVQRWIASLLQRFNFDISQQQLSELQGLMQSHNLSPLDVNALERCRVVLTRRGTFPSRCLTLDDLRAIVIEKTDDRESLRIALHGNQEAVQTLMNRKGISIY